MGDEADAMWDADLIEEGREFAESLRSQPKSRRRKARKASARPSHDQNSEAK